jgi:putative hydrolase of the HAD superfamily
VIRTFLFDMGNVLVHFCHQRMCRQIADLAQTSEEIVRDLLMRGSLQWDFERGLLTEEEFFAELRGRLQFSAEITREEFVRAGSDIFTLNASLIPVLDELRALGHRLVLLSNTSVSHFEFVQNEFDVLSRFDDFVLSFKVGAMKPERRIFEVAGMKIGCPPEQCFYTDDIAAYIEAGRSYGFQAEQFTTTESFVGQIGHRGIRLESVSTGRSIA